MLLSAAIPVLNQAETIALILPRLCGNQMIARYEDHASGKVKTMVTSERPSAEFDQCAPSCMRAARS